MPNWCENTMRIIALTDEARALLPRLVLGFSDDPGTKLHAFEVLMPTPEELEQHPAPNRDEELAAEFTKKYGYPDWYEWRVAHWGTKWASEWTGSEEFDGGLIANFWTAWSPPVGIYEKLVELGFDVYATYIESGAGYAGRWDNGDDRPFDIVAPTDEDEESVLEATFGPQCIPQNLWPQGLGG